MATCKNCGTEDLTWRKSAKGNWYLSDPSTISTNTHGNFITIPTAHYCPTPTDVQVFSKERLLLEKANLLQIKELFPNDWKMSDQWALDSIEAKIQEKQG